MRHLRIGSVAVAVLLACHVGACVPEPNNPRLNVEAQVRQAFADSLAALRTGSPQRVLATVADNFVLKTDNEVLTRDAAIHRLASDRQILTFDKVTPDSVVVTSDDLSRRYIEVWVRTPPGWRLARMNEVQTF